jgi:hypothetical protein
MVYAHLDYTGMNASPTVYAMEVFHLARQDETQQFQSLIGAMQWAVSIGRLDIATAVMSLSSFRAMPRRGHLERAKQIYGYLRKMKEARI